MNLQRMLDKCRRGQWSIDDLDWDVEPRPMTRLEEERIVQYFTDMAGIERFAKALFVEQHRRVEDPVLAEIFTTFITDEERHAQVAERLAEFYNRHRYRDYQLHPDLVAFRPVFLDAIRYLTAEFANLYITTGEVLLDVALLRGLSEYVDDEMCRRAMHLINRDESRHIAVDYYMAGFYASAAHQAKVRGAPRQPLAHHARALVAIARVVRQASPFIQSIFVEPLRMVDPSDRHMRDAFKRIQLLGRKPELAARPFARFLRVVQLGYNTPVIGRLFGSVFTRLAGVPGIALHITYDRDEERRAQVMSYDEHVRATYAVKRPPGTAPHA